MKKSAFQFFLSLLCLLLMVTCASGETRESVIWLEGMEETIIETKFESPEGFSFWYDADLMEAAFDTVDDTERVMVSNIDSDDFMLLSLISQEEADELIGDREVETAQDPETGRITTEVYCELENTSFHFLTLISENGKILRAEGVYSMEAAEGNAKYFRRILDSAVLASPQNNPAG
jgi:hypothetical protein